MDDTEKLHEKLSRLYCQSLNLFLQMEVLNGLLQVENDERQYYVISNWGEFFIGIKNALVTAIVVDFAKIVSDPSKNVVSLKRIKHELSEHNKQNSRDKVLTLSAHPDLDVWFETHNTTIGKIKIIRDIEAAHNNGQKAKLVDKLFWAEVEESIRQLRDLLLKMINSLKRHHRKQTCNGR